SPPSPAPVRPSVSISTAARPCWCLRSDARPPPPLCCGGRAGPLTSLRRVVFPTIRIGDRQVDVRPRALVMGILNRTPDSFYDRGATWSFDAFLRRAEELITDGADL